MAPFICDYGTQKFKTAKKLQFKLKLEAREPVGSNRSRVSNTSRVSNKSREVWQHCSNTSRGLLLEEIRYYSNTAWGWVGWQCRDRNKGVSQKDDSKQPFFQLSHHRHYKHSAAMDLQDEHHNIFILPDVIGLMLSVNFRVLPSSYCSVVLCKITLPALSEIA